MTQLKNKIKKTIFSTSKVKHNTKIKKNNTYPLPKGLYFIQIDQNFPPPPIIKVKK
jgi:hypothetical protein